MDPKKVKEKLEQRIPDIKGLPKINGMTGLITGMLGAGIVSMLGGQMMKMFGESERLPKGVIKEIIEGMLAGTIEHFEEKIDDLRNELKYANEELESKKEEIERFQRTVAEHSSVIDQLNVEIDKLRVKKDGKNKHKRKR